MEKYRIVSNHTTRKLENISWKIQRRGFFGWKTIKVHENGSSTGLSFVSFEAAEEYMIANYFGDGYFFKPYPNEYHYESYTYWL